MFTQKIKKEAMIACGRRCCLCHKFCGGKMECHHIIEVAHGGKDTFENCIPLCLDCHAEVGHYNGKHPKGVNFSERELKAHRDRWYETIELGLTPNAPKDYEKLDVRLFQKIVETLGGSEKMRHFRDHDYACPYSADIEQTLRYFIDLCEHPETEFFNLKMEERLRDLCQIVIRYQEKKGNRIWGESCNVMNIPPEWAHSDNEADRLRFDEARSTMNKEATNIWNGYSDFIKEGRRILRAEIE